MIQNIPSFFKKEETYDIAMAHISLCYVLMLWANFDVVINYRLRLLLITETENLTCVCAQDLDFEMKFQIIREMLTVIALFALICISLQVILFYAS